MYLAKRSGYCVNKKAGAYRMSLTGWAYQFPRCQKIEVGFTDINLSRLEQIAAIFDLTVSRLLDLNVLQEKSELLVDLEKMLKRLAERDAEVMSLQKKLIGVLQELKTAEDLISRNYQIAVSPMP